MSTVCSILRYAIIGALMTCATASMLVALPTRLSCRTAYEPLDVAPFHTEGVVVSQRSLGFAFRVDLGYGAFRSGGQLMRSARDELTSAVPDRPDWSRMGGGNLPNAYVVAEVAAGWPMKAMYGCVAQEYRGGVEVMGSVLDARSIMRTQSALWWRWLFPIRPILPGFVVNMSVWGFAACVMERTFYAARRWRRLRHGLCAHCGYAISQFRVNTCPECGYELPEPSNSLRIR